MGPRTLLERKGEDEEERANRKWIQGRTVKEERKGESARYRDILKEV